MRWTVKLVRRLDEKFSWPSFSTSSWLLHAWALLPSLPGSAYEWVTDTLVLLMIYLIGFPFLILSIGEMIVDQLFPKQNH